MSLWPFLRACYGRAPFASACYRRDAAAVWPCCELGALELWTGLHLRDHPALHHRTSPALAHPTEAQALAALLARRDAQLAALEAKLEAREEERA